MEEVKKTTLGGFDAILDQMIPNYHSEEDEDTHKIENDDDLDLETIKKQNNDPFANKVKTEKEDKTKKQDKSQSDEDDELEEDQDDETEDNEDQDDDTKKSDVKGKSNKKSNKKDESISEESVSEENEGDQEDESKKGNEQQVITYFFDALAEKLGWQEDEENKPKNADELIDYFSNVIQENSTPEYSSEEVKQLDEYVRNGGDLKNYFQIDDDLDLETVNLEDESDQKKILREYLKEKGISNEKISKRISRYEDLGALQDEATDALDELKEIKSDKKEQLLADQKKAQEEAITKQRQYYTAVVDEIKGLDNIRGIKVPDKDKTTLMNYIFKPEADGKTKYQKDYAKSLKNLIESAYFTMKGDTLLNAAKQEGSKSATDRFKNSLRNSSVSNKNKTNLQPQNNYDIWKTLSNSLSGVD